MGIKKAIISIIFPEKRHCNYQTYRMSAMGVGREENKTVLFGISVWTIGDEKNFFNKFSIIFI